MDMFTKLASKYKVQNPLQSSSQVAKSNTHIEEKAQLLPPAHNPQSVPFGNVEITPQLNLDVNSHSQQPSMFSNQLSSGSSFPFSSSHSQGNSQSPFGSSSVGANQLPAFGGSGAPFGHSNSNTAAPLSSPFGQTTTSLSSNSPFGNSGNDQMGAANLAAAPSNSQFSGRSPRDMLYSFYQQYNPQKLAEVDKVLVKYNGNEEQMFRNLAKKYNMDPSVFGLSSAPAPSIMTGVGMAGISSPVGFGQPSALGGGPTFGGVSTPTTPSFGGGSFGSNVAPTSSGFGFGSLAQSTPAPSGFGSFSSPTTAPFGASTPFGAPRR